MSRSRIWKYDLEFDLEQTVEMPIGAQILDVQRQGMLISMWAICDPDALKEARKFAIYSTGLWLPENPGKYIATFQWIPENLVFHVFEIAS